MEIKVELNLNKKKDKFIFEMFQNEKFDSIIEDIDSILFTNYFSPGVAWSMTRDEIEKQEKPTTFVGRLVHLIKKYKNLEK